MCDYCYPCPMEWSPSRVWWGGGVVVPLSPPILTAILQVNLGQLELIEAKDDGGGGDNWTTVAINRAKLQSNQETNIQFFMGRMPFMSPNQRCQSTEGSCNKLTSPSLVTLHNLTATWAYATVQKLVVIELCPDEMECGP